MLRTKRVAIEATRMTYQLGSPNDVDAEILVLPVHGLSVTLHLERTYPFSPPSILVGDVYADKKFAQQYQRIHALVKAYHLVLPCVCCSMRCAWCPTYGLREVLDEYVEVSTRLNQLEGYADVLSGLPFDDAVHSLILHFL
jgi:hypothetical protein